MDQLGDAEKARGRGRRRWRRALGVEDSLAVFDRLKRLINPDRGGREGRLGTECRVGYGPRISTLGPGMIR